VGGLIRRNVSGYSIKNCVKLQKFSTSAAGVSGWRVWKRAPPNYESEASVLETTCSEIPINYAKCKQRLWEICTLHGNSPCCYICFVLCLLFLVLSG